MAEDFSLKAGARIEAVYRINSTKDAAVEGEYRGMAMIGTETALVLDTDSGRTYVSASSVVTIRTVRDAPSEEPKKASGEDREFYV